jgi:dienelactone hydrolase
VPITIGRWIAALLLILPLNGWAGERQGAVSFATLSRGPSPVIITATVYHPGGSGPFPGIVVLHTCNGINRALQAKAQRFTSQGYVTIVPDSFGPRGSGPVCASQSITDGDRVPDAYAAANYLRTLSDVRADRIGVIGYSHGGGVVTALVTRPPLAKPFQAAVGYYANCYNRHDRPNAPTLVLQGEKDDWGAPGPCLTWEKGVHDPAMLQVIVYPGAYHAFDVPGIARDMQGGRGIMHHLEYNEAADQDASARTAAFFAKWLK